MHIPQNIVVDFLFQNLQQTTKTGTNTFKARCPYCGDSAQSLTKKRFNLIYKSPETILWNCFNCNQSGNFLQLYAFIKNTTTKQAQKDLRINSLTNIQFNTIKKPEPKPIPTFEDFSWILNDCITTPDGIIQTQLYNKFLEFKNTRKIDYPMFVTYKGEFKNRVILPIYQNNQMIYFQARTLTNSSKKYKNPISPKQHIIFNKNNWDTSKPIIITEGMLDTLSIGNQATMCLGSSISTEFLQNIPTIPIIALDNDPTGKKETLSLAKKYPYIKFAIYKKEHKHLKDPNDLLINNINPYEYILNNSHSSLKTISLLKLCT